MKFIPAMDKRTSFDIDLWCRKIFPIEEENVDQTVLFVCDNYEYFYQDRFYSSIDDRSNFQYLGNGSYRSIPFRSKKNG
jgi:hypothetical protein